jgi:hypothetical protein
MKALNNRKIAFITTTLIAVLDAIFHGMNASIRLVDIGSVNTASKCRERIRKWQKYRRITRTLSKSRQSTERSITTTTIASRARKSNANIGNREPEANRAVKSASSLVSISFP